MTATLCLFTFNSNSTLIHEENRPYFRDLTDHIMQVIENIDAIQTKISGINDLYLNVINTKTNEVMKVLTLVAKFLFHYHLLPGSMAPIFNISQSLSRVEAILSC